MSSSITRNAEEGLGANNGADGNPEHDAAFVAFLASDELSTREIVSPPRPTSTTPTNVSHVNTSTSGFAATITSRRDGDLNIERPREAPPPRDRNDAEIPRNDEDKGLLKLAKTFLGLFFQAALALMAYRQQSQPQQGSTDSSNNAPGATSQSSVLFNWVWAAILFGFAFTMSGIILQKHHQNQNVANFCSYAGVFLGALGFFFMMDIFADKGLGWVVWAVGGILLLVFAYTLRK